MHLSTFRRNLCSNLATVFVTTLIACHPAFAQGHGHDELVPPPPPLSETALRAVEAPFLNEEERADRRVFHGVWRERDLEAAHRKAQAAMYEYRLHDPVLTNDEIRIDIRAEAALLRGEYERAVELLEIENPTIKAHRIRAEALDWLGQHKEADAALDPVFEALASDEIKSPEELTEAARSMMLRARLRGEPSRDYQRIIGLLSRIHQRVDRLHWPAKLVEAQLLDDKDNTGQAVESLHEVLALNAHSSEAWYLLGQIALYGYDFASAEAAAERLRELNPDHVLADLLDAESELLQRMPDAAEARIQSILSSMPEHRIALGFRAAIEAARYNEEAMWQALRDLDERSPGQAFGYYFAGRQLANDRQYELAARVLNEAIHRQPNWPAPQIELGLLEMQSGKDESALIALRRVAQLDPFNRRAAFSLRLLESLMSYSRIESSNFIIRYDGESSDRVLAREMAPLLESMHEEVSATFQHTPEVKTQIELMPNHERFAVRITGMPDIHTIAASTGPIIAMESPREGPGHWGTYDWLRVLRHEYVHTVTLSRTNNRIPHWFTEAAAVWQERSPRDYHTCQSLTAAYLRNRLFDMEEINWAFVRPKRPGDRSLAYAQSHWMFEYIIERFGHRAMLDLLDAYRAGESEANAYPDILGITRETFHQDFLVWARSSLRQWGMLPEPAMSDLLDNLARTDPEVNELVAQQAEAIAAQLNRRLVRLMQRPIDFEKSEYVRDGLDGPGIPLADGRRLRLFTEVPTLRVPLRALDDAHIDSLLNAQPAHPDALELKIARMRENQGVTWDLEPYLLRYLEARPVDPMPMRLLAALYLDSEQPSRAIPFLEELDRREQSTGVYALELAKRYRADGQYQRAFAKVKRALVIEPFNANYRELAAAIAIQSKDYDEARHQLEALVAIEPSRKQHVKRLEALDRLEQRAGNPNEEG